MLFPLILDRSVTFLQRWWSLDLSACILTAGLKNKLMIPSRRFWGRGCNIICRWAAVWYMLRLLFPVWLLHSNSVWIAKSGVELGEMMGFALEVWKDSTYPVNYSELELSACFWVVAWVCWVSNWKAFPRSKRCELSIFLASGIFRNPDALSGVAIWLLQSCVPPPSASSL